ncbi:hypothetical protein HCN44_004015 [Aphidius gifuensis]|uniref:cyclin-dependent kinase n=1 Tax=Aphidius gifuensis TaxID=684658 RepID=A0A834XW26_APHGI|nr:cyclin-dependent kinase 11A-like [Aphidius gifuensis]KAF7994543.1 hypothetical protein HCN44_004015 [Aphidius gifuensis]
MDVDNHSEQSGVKKNPNDLDEFSFSDEDNDSDTLNIKPPQVKMHRYKSSLLSHRRDRHNDKNDRRNDNKEYKSSRYYEREERHRNRHRHRSRHSGGGGGGIDGLDRSESNRIIEGRDLHIDERRYAQMYDEQQHHHHQQQQQHYIDTNIVVEQSIEKQRQEKRHKRNHKHDKIRDREKIERDSREFREQQLREIMAIIPSDEIESMDTMEPQISVKEPREMTEQELSRDRLLEAEQEKARRKELLRFDLEAQRLNRGKKRSRSPEHGTDFLTVELSDESIRSRRSGNQSNSPRSTGRNLSNDRNNEQEKSSDGATSDTSTSHSNDEDDDNNVNNNASNDSDKTSVDGSNVDSDDNNPSPLSVDRLAKSDHSDGDSPGHIESNGVSQNTTIVDDLPVDENNHEDNKKDDNNDYTEKKSLEENDNGDELPPYLPAIQGCRSVEEFQCLNRIEEGTYGVVYRAKCKRTNEIVALKRLKMEKEKEGFPITSLREINTLLKAQHENIVTVREIVVGSNMDRIFIVMDYVEHDLKSLMETMKQKKQVFIPGEVKCLMQQLLKAVLHLHDNWILHRDLKTSNLLLSHRGILKVGDFGLAREYGSPLRQYTPVVVTLWYRAPELLLNYKEYSTPIDMWSVGCIFAELVRMEALFPGRTEIDQLQKIFKELGTPNDKILPGYSKLSIAQPFSMTAYSLDNLRQRFGLTLTTNGIDLLTKLLTYDPSKRLTAEDSLRHEYFKEAPYAIDPEMFPTWPAKSELGVKTKNASPKPPSGGGQYKQLGDGDEPVELNSSGGFHMGITTKRGRSPPVAGAGFHLKF